jgi:ornithine carbamoyltransferase
MGHRDLLSLDDLDATTITALLEDAVALAAAWNDRDVLPSLAGRRIALVRDDGGWRNTTALALGAAELGATVVDVPVTLSGRESLADLAGYLDNWFDLIAIRSPSLSRLRELADDAEAPVINLRTTSNHPCETLGDLAHVVARRGMAGLDGLRVVAIAPEGNILGSWVEASAVLPITVTQVYPERWHVEDAPSDRFAATADLDAIDDADLLITDCWPTDATPADLLAYQVDIDLLTRLATGAHFIPCPPVTRGEEVSADAMDHSSCQVPAAKAWLLHAQNAVLRWALRTDERS